MIGSVSHKEADNIKHKLIIMSGKGGVGKTTVAVNLAYALSERGLRVGLLDVDIHGPNVPKMLNLEEKKVGMGEGKILPVLLENGLKVMSMAFLLDRENAVIWRGPMKHKVIMQFIQDVDWGELDYLVIDFPPGTGDEAISISQLLSDITGSIIVSTPQQVALADIVRSIDFSRKVGIPIIGLIENMAGDVFGGGGVKDLADAQGIAFLGSLELDKKITEMGDGGKPFVADKTLDSAESFGDIVERITEAIQK